jgi:hypothetical protein
MGSPIPLRSASIFKRKNKKTEKQDAEQDNTTGVIKEGSVSDFFKTVITKRVSHGSKGENADDDKTITGISGDEETVKDFVRTESDSSLESKGKEYVVERLGLGVVGEPQPIEHQYRFVKKQIEKARKRFLGQKIVKSSL